MKTVHEVRRERLQMLVAEMKGMANLCEALGFARNETARLTRILNANVRHERGGKPYVMGDDLARQIEIKLNRVRGWMDTPPGMEYMNSERMQALHRVAEELKEYQLDQLIKIGATLAEPKEPKNGTVD